MTNTQEVDPRARAKYLVALVGANIRRERYERGMSSEQLGAVLNVASSTIRRLENGTHDIRLSTLFEIAWALGIPITQLLRKPPSGVHRVNL